MENIEEEIKVRQEQHEKEKLIIEILELQRDKLNELDNDELKMIIEEFKK